jgi:hypothetical protein
MSGHEAGSRLLPGAFNMRADFFAKADPTGERLPADLFLLFLTHAAVAFYNATCTHK